MELPIIAPSAPDTEKIRATPDWNLLSLEFRVRIGRPRDVEAEEKGVKLKDLLVEYDLSQAVALACLAAAGVKPKRDHYDIDEAGEAFDYYAPEEDYVPRKNLSKIAGPDVLAKAIEEGILEVVYRLGEFEWFAADAEEVFREWRRAQKDAELATTRRLRAEVSAARKAAIRPARGDPRPRVYPEGLIASHTAAALLQVSRGRLAELVKRGMVPVAKKMPGPKGAWLFDPQVLRGLHLHAPEGYLGTVEAGVLVGRTHQALSEACRRGRIPCIIEKGNYYVRLEDAQAYVERIRVQREALIARARESQRAALVRKALKATIQSKPWPKLIKRKAKV
jgi:hypothetical protein